MMRRKNIERKKKIIFITKKAKRVMITEFSPLLKNCAFLTLYLIINFFTTKIGFLMKIKKLINIILSYLSIVKIILKM